MALYSLVGAEAVGEWQLHLELLGGPRYKFILSSTTRVADVALKTTRTAMETIRTTLCLHHTQEKENHSLCGINSDTACKDLS